MDRAMAGCGELENGMEPSGGTSQNKMTISPMKHGKGRTV
jgi:hypothetical protein